MSDRLKSFRNLMSAFEGSSNPQRAIERGFYIDLPNNPVGEIARRIELSPSSVHLLLGGIGSGKTTQLLLATERLNTLEDIKAIYVDVSLYTDIADLQPGALIAIAAYELLKLLEEENIPFPEELRDSLNRFADGYDVCIDGESHEDYYYEMHHIHRKGLLYKEINKESDEFKRLFLDLSLLISDNIKKGVIFLFDGLDRLRDTQIFINSSLNDIFYIQKLGFGTALVGSLLIEYEAKESIENSVGRSYYIPYLDVEEHEEARAFFSTILAVRDTNSFITEPTRSLLISHSGGVLRDLMSLIQSAIEEAYFDGSDNVGLVHVEKAIWSFTRSKVAGLTRAGLDTIKQILVGKDFFPQTSEDTELLVGGYILEYRYPYRRFAVHPVIAKYVSTQLTAIVANG